MPKNNNISTKRNDLKRFIKLKMATEEVRQVDLAEELYITQGAFSQKLKKAQFDFSELVIIFKRLRVSDDEISKLF